ncbi:Tat pathway signal sequence [Actinomyces timonensis]|uniref:Tat pathway signal sequence n=1 Tax=Actinomyces timonensis TaxID=1288391 RepID=A0AAU8N5V3_9ACTO
MTDPASAPAGPGDGASRLPGPPGAPEAAGRGRITRRRALLAAGGLALAGGAAGALMTCRGPDEVGPSTTITLVLRGTDGAPMTLAQARAIQSAGRGEDGYDDALLDSTTLEVIAIGPLYEEDGAILVDVPGGRDCALCLSWPTSQGYSALIADLPRDGSAEVLALAARGLHQRQRAALAALAGRGGPASASTSALGAARAAHEATQSAIDSGIGDEQGARLLEFAATAQIAIDTALIGAAPPGALIGATLTEAPSPEQRGAVVAATGPGRQGAVRLVLDDVSAPALAAWRETADALQRAGIHVMGQICDSEALAALSDPDFDMRLDALLTALPGLDSWEVGNELGGDWLGEDPVGRATRAARAVKERTGALTVLTLYYQLGQAGEQGALFNVAASLAAGELMGLVDVVGISVYPQSHPLGTAADRVMSALADRFPGKRVAVTELGYGGEDLDDGPWWFGSREDVDAARSALIAQVTGAALGRPQAWGAPFWWYFLGDEAAGEGGAGGGGADYSGAPEGGGLGAVGRSLKQASERASAPGS